MNATEAVQISQGYTRMSLTNFIAFLLFSLAFAGVTVLSPDIHETAAYADVRKVMCIGFTLPGIVMLLIALHFTAKSNAAMRLAEELMFADEEKQSVRSIGIFRQTSTLWALFFMTAIIIVTNYITLIYAVDGGLF